MIKLNPLRLNLKKLSATFIENWLATSIVVAVLLLFFPQLKYWFDELLVAAVLSQLQPTLLVDAGMLIIFSLIISWSFYLIQHGHNLSKLFVGSVITCSFLYALVLITHSYNLYTFTLSPFRYADFWIILAAGVVMVKLNYLINKNRALPDHSDPFLTDAAITSESDDELGRTGFAISIARKIESSTKENASLAIGINGQWGSGKTSFLHLIKIQLNINKQIIIDFNPWRNAGAKSINTQFFERLSEELSSYDTRLRKLVATYGASFSEMAKNNIIGEAWNKFTDTLSGEDEHPDHEKINHSIKKLKKRIIIFIDDLDRLDHQEIIQVLKLIRNTGNFSNIVYVAAYDRAYVNEAIKKHNIYQFQKFIDKIFDVEFSLPIFESGYITHFLAKTLKGQLAPTYHEELLTIISQQEYTGKSLAETLLTTRRDVVRFCNAFLFDIQPVMHEVAIRDFYLITLLRYKFKPVFDGLSIENHRFFYTGNGLSTSEIISYRSHADNGKSSEVAFFEKVYDTNTKPQKREDRELDFYLNQLLAEEIIRETDKNIIWNIVKMLVPTKDINFQLFGQKKVNPKAFCFARNYHKYFSYQLFSGDISNKEFESLRRGKYEAFEEKVKQWATDGRRPVLMEKISSIKEFDNRQEFENFIRVYFCIGRLSWAHSSWITSEFAALYRAIDYPLQPKNTFYPSVEEYKQFILQELLTTEEYPIFNSSFVGGLLTLDKENIFSANELEEINRNYLKQYGERITSWNPDMWSLYHNCLLGKEKREEKKFKDPLAKAYLIKRFIELTRAEELGFFISQGSLDAPYFYFHDQTWSFFIERVDQLLHWITTFPSVDQDSNSFKEFKQFFDSTAGKNYQAVPFDFKYLIVSRFN